MMGILGVRTGILGVQEEYWQYKRNTGNIEHLSWFSLDQSQIHKTCIELVIAVKAYKQFTHCHNELKLILEFKSHNTLDTEFETYHKFVMTVKAKTDCH